MTIRIDRMLSQNPAFTMSLISNVPDPKTIALGAVATGSINAQEEAIVIGTINTKGFMLMACASAARIGNISVQVAMF